MMNELTVEAAGTQPIVPSGDRLGRIRALAAQVLDLDVEIADLEHTLKERKAARHEIVGRRLVDLMDDPESPVEELTVRGTAFKADDYFHASIKEDNRDAAHDWLEANDYGALIKYAVVVTFPKDSQEQAAALARYARERYQEAEVEITRGVPWKRLTSWLKEHYEGRGEEGWQAPPLDLLGATVGRVVKLGKLRGKK